MDFEARQAITRYGRRFYENIFLHSVIGPYVSSPGSSGMSVLEAMEATWLALSDVLGKCLTFWNFSLFSG